MPYDRGFVCLNKSAYYINMKNIEKMSQVISYLKENIRADCALESGGDPWKLLVMARLSAQCTDARVNIVSVELFKRFPTVCDMAECDIHELEELIKSCGLYRSKASSIKASAQIIVSQFAGEVPSSMDDLLSLPGVGRKIANLVRGDLFNLGGVVADTHCIRICGRLGFYPETLKDAVKVEKILDPLIPVSEQTDFCHRLVWFGRQICSARAPMCEMCGLRDICTAYRNK